MNNDFENQQSPIKIKTSKLYCIYIYEFIYFTVGTFLIKIFLDLISYQEIRLDDIILYFYSAIIYIVLSLCRIKYAKYVYNQQNYLIN
jgi:hypothetical protein